MRTDLGRRGKEGEVGVRTRLFLRRVSAVSGSKDRCVLGNGNLGDLREVGKSSCNVQVSEAW